MGWFVNLRLVIMFSSNMSIIDALDGHVIEHIWEVYCGNLLKNVMWCL